MPRQGMAQSWLGTTGLLPFHYLPNKTGGGGMKKVLFQSECYILILKVCLFKGIQLLDSLFDASSQCHGAFVTKPSHPFMVPDIP